jgi:hypothetical protein
MNTNPSSQTPQRSAQPLEDGPDQAAAGPSPRTVLPPRAPQPWSVKFARQGSPRRNIDVPRGAATIWWLGVHGGAGETTLAQLLEGSWETGHAWPHSNGQPTELPHVILVARTNARGLRAAQLAAIEWASGSVAVQLHGLVFVADAPGRLPKPLRDFAHIVAGGVPRVWRLPWVEAWRLGEPVSANTAPKAVTDVLDDLRALRLTADAPIPTP